MEDSEIGREEIERQIKQTRRAISEDALEVFDSYAKEEMNMFHFALGKIHGHTMRLYELNARLDQLGGRME